MKIVILILTTLSSSLLLAHSNLSQLETRSFSNGETCSVSQKLPNVKYTKGDLKKETLLCSEELESPMSLFASCPKTINTNPAIETYLLDSTMGQSEFENTYCSQAHLDNVKIPFKKIAKLKSTVTCSYAASPVSYYHLSRYFGNILNIPVAVVREVSPEFIIKQADRIPKIKGLTSTIRATWSIFKKLVTNKSDPKSKYIYNNEKIYGAFISNPTGEKKFLEYMNHAGGIQKDRAAAFKKEDVYIQLSDITSIKKLISSNVEKNVKIEKLLLLQDFSDMIILDTLLSQEDRYNNIAYQEEFIDTQSLRSLQKSEYNPQIPTHLKHKRLVIKDNDCGVSAEGPTTRLNINVATGIINGLSHMNPQTYKKLLELAVDIQTENYSRFFQEQSLMTPADFKKFKNTTLKLATELKAKYESGNLKLDLDLASLDAVN